MEGYVLNEHMPKDNSKAYSEVKSEKGFEIEGVKHLVRCFKHF